MTEDQVRVYSSSKRIDFTNLDIAKDKDHVIGNAVHENLLAILHQAIADGGIVTKDILDVEDGIFILENSISIIKPEISGQSFKNDLEQQRKDGLLEVAELIGDIRRKLYQEEKFIINTNYLKIIQNEIMNRVREVDRSYPEREKIDG